MKGWETSRNYILLFSKNSKRLGDLEQAGKYAFATDAENAFIERQKDLKNGESLILVQELVSTYATEEEQGK
jgi:hypothetical protein